MASNQLLATEYDRHIFVKEDEFWDLRGRFNAAVETVEPLSWVTQGNVPVLALAMVRISLLIHSIPSCCCRMSPRML
jgi:hypothetical protein